MISVICCYNRISEYQNLLESLQNQNCEFEIVGVDNTKHSFSSAAAALNHGASMAQGEYFVFLHQDIIFLKHNSLQEFVQPLHQYDNCIVGIYGAVHGDSVMIGEYQKCDTLDECCVAMCSDTWRKFPYNEELCDGWHLYEVEQCLRAKTNGGLILSGNFNIQHLSTGKVDDAYMNTYKRIMAEYKKEKWIATTCKSLPNNNFVFGVYWLLWKIKKILLGNYNLIYNLKKLVRGIK